MKLYGFQSLRLEREREREKRKERGREEKSDEVDYQEAFTSLGS